LDLNYLYHRQGVSLMMAEHASCDRSRDAHHSLAIAYAARIERARRPSTKLAACEIR